jgi:hypothetical protein
VEVWIHGQSLTGQSGDERDSECQGEKGTSKGRTLHGDLLWFRWALGSEAL